ncbi:hypothetical protein A3Q56_04456 [Intoshia linei]|uniref:U1 small nuclear ribonucleoprotein C n=1 Tax=Intoshia linei TaxID=1819745 RepID=A0A177B123_9BILA|nr:hypothetical protein A3Q56_04456 [Intoshia linei]
MPKYYCDYCSTHLTHDSRSVRRTHNTGRKHCDNVREYYRRWFDSRIQEMIDRTTAVYESNIAVQNSTYVPPGGFMPPPFMPPSMPNNQLPPALSNQIPPSGPPNLNAPPPIFNTMPVNLCVPPPIANPNGPTK